MRNKVCGVARSSDASMALLQMRRPSHVDLNGDLRDAEPARQSSATSSIAIMQSEPHVRSAQTSPHPNPVYPART